MRAVISLAWVIPAVLAMYFPIAPQNLTIVNSTHEKGVSISYREPKLCETTPGVRSFAGYVHLEEDSQISQNYPINTFFWFFESRKDPKRAPLVIWLNGGPGTSSMLGLLQGNGPCVANSDSNSTTLNSWSWNNEANMLYIDQPVQVGFSYDRLTNCTFNSLTGATTVQDFSEMIPTQNNSLYIGTFASQNSNSTVNSTLLAGKSLWHFMQIWLNEFHEYRPHDNKLSIWTESYGGQYGPTFARYFLEESQRITNHTSNNTQRARPINLDTIGIINGCLDLAVEGPQYAEMAYNNTYGIKLINESTYTDALQTFKKPGGCLDRLSLCRTLVAVGDPNFNGNNVTVNKACADANKYCLFNYADQLFIPSGRAADDLAIIKPNFVPPRYYTGFLSQQWVQRELGVPLNFTAASVPVEDAFFFGTGDPNAAHPGQTPLTDLAYLLDSGVKVAMLYGDRDLTCNWLGGEADSLAVNYSDASSFRSAGYTALHTNNSYTGGQVRQHSNFSFARVYDSGHEVAAYQPETAYQIFHRAMFNRDVATGKLEVSENYSTRGPRSVRHIKNVAPESPRTICYVLDLQDSCTDEQVQSVLNGSAVVKDYIVMEDGSSGDM